MKYFLFIFTSILLLSGCSKNSPGIPQDSSSKSGEYYETLRASCPSSTSKCCLESIDTMERGGFIEYNFNACPGGMRPSDQKCSGSKVWCEPDKLPL